MQHPSQLVKGTTEQHVPLSPRGNHTSTTTSPQTLEARTDTTTTPTTSTTPMGTDTTTTRTSVTTQTTTK